jgi:hypothetical protein
MSGFVTSLVTTKLARANPIFVSSCHSLSIAQRPILYYFSINGISFHFMGKMTSPSEAEETMTVGRRGAKSLALATACCSSASTASGLI